MATLTASNTSQLKAALSNARPGDTVKLAAGNYGALDLNGGTNAGSHLKFSGTVTITSDPGKAVFTKVGLTSVSNLAFKGVKFDYDPGKSGTTKPFYAQKSKGITYDGVTFDGAVKNGYGSGTGLDVRESTDVTVKNSNFVNLYNSLRVNTGKNVDVLNNSFKDSAYDAMAFGSIDDLLISGNRVDMRAIKGVAHIDAIQVVNGGGAPGTGIVIRGNVLDSSDGITHGIYMGNERAKQTGNMSDFYENVLIENNKIYAGQMLGIALGETDGAVVRYNTVLRHSDQDSTKAVNMPVIRFAEDSRDIKITGNVTYENPGPANSSWQLTGAKHSSWVISGNKIVSKSTQGSSGQQAAASAVAEPDSPVGTDGDGNADGFRFDGSKLDKDTTSTVKGLDFADGDTLVFIHYDAGTFEDIGGGNILQANAAGTYVVIDSIADLRELDQASKAVSISADRSTDVLALEIDQGAMTHRVALHDMADAFLL